MKEDRKEKGNVPNLRFPQFHGEWEKKKINTLTNIKAGATPSTLNAEYWNGNIRWMSSGELNKKRIYEVNGRISELGLQRTSTTLVPSGCVLIGLAGQGKTRGTAAINYVELCTNQSIASILPSKNVNSEFLYQNIESRYQELRDISSGDGGRGGLNLSIIGNLYVPICSMAEQQKIAQFLHLIDQRIETQNKIIKELESLIKGIRQTLFKETTTWKSCKIGDILKIGSGRDYKHLETGNIPVFGTGGYMLSVNDYLYDGESVCIGRKGTINKPLFLYGKFWTVDTLFYTYNFQRLLPRFCYYLFSSINWLQYNEASGVPSLSKETIENIQVHLPNMGEQEKICSILDLINSKLETENKTLSAYQVQKKYILNKLFI